MADRAHIERLARDLTDKGMLIEAGWVGLRLAAIPLNAPGDQLREMRMAFMAGAQHLFSSIMAQLDPGIEETDDDMRRMSMIDAELKAFAKEIELRVTKAKGNG